MPRIAGTKCRKMPAIGPYALWRHVHPSRNFHRINLPQHSKFRAGTSPENRFSPLHSASRRKNEANSENRQFS